MVSCTGRRALRILSPASPSIRSYCSWSSASCSPELLEPRPDRGLGAVVPSVDGRPEVAEQPLPLRFDQRERVPDLLRLRGRDGAGAPRLERRLRALARLQRPARERTVGTAARGLDERREEQRADTEQDQPERPVAGGEEHEREHEHDDRDAEEELRRRDAEPVRLGLPVVGGVSSSGTCSRTVEPASPSRPAPHDGQNRARSGASAPQEGQGSVLGTDALMPGFCPRLERM